MADVDAIASLARDASTPGETVVRGEPCTPREPFVTSDVFAGLRRELDALLALDPLVLGDGASVIALLREASRVEALTCRQAAAFDRSGEWAVAGAQNSPSWVTTRCRGERRIARRRLRLGRALGWMDHVRRSFVSGRITLDHVEVLARARDRSKLTAIAFGRDQANLVGWAESKKFHQFRRDIEEWQQRVDAHGAERDATKHHDQRRFHLSQSFENMWFADGILDPISGEIVHGVLSRIERELFHADWQRAKHQLGRRPLTGELARTPMQRRADAFVEMARRAETAPARGKRPAPLFTVLVGEDTFARTCELASGTVITPGAAARWLDQALIERIVFDGPDRVMSVGHRRTFTGALRRAIHVRDRTCAHPCCDQPADTTEVDHIEPWAVGGPTTQRNGRAYCAFHNRLRSTDTRKPTRFPGPADADHRGFAGDRPGEVNDVDAAAPPGSRVRSRPGTGRTAVHAP